MSKVSSPNLARGEILERDNVCDNACYIADNESTCGEWRGGVTKPANCGRLQGHSVHVVL